MSVRKSTTSAMLINAGSRLHLQHGPIDLIVSATAINDVDREISFHAATDRFETILEELMREINILRRPIGPKIARPQGQVAGRMVRAAYLHKSQFLTPMAAVAGAVADEVLGAMTCAAPLTRAYVNNGGDIAVHLGPGQSYKSAILTPDGRELGRISLDETDRARGIATSGQGGRSLSFGIADSVTVLAENGAAADVAATLIANAVDLGTHPAITRRAACDLVPESDLGPRAVVTHVGPLVPADIKAALDAGRAVAQHMMEMSLINGAALFLRDDVRFIGALEASQHQQRVTHA